MTLGIPLNPVKWYTHKNWSSLILCYLDKVWYEQYEAPETTKVIYSLCTEKCLNYVQQVGGYSLYHVGTLYIAVVTLSCDLIMMFLKKKKELLLKFYQPTENASKAKQFPLKCFRSLCHCCPKSLLKRFILTT